MVAYQVVEIEDVAGGLLYYVAQSFLLAGSIFGLDQYLRIIKKYYHENPNEYPLRSAPPLYPPRILPLIVYLSYLYFSMRASAWVSPRSLALVRFLIPSALSPLRHWARPLKR